jgi:hypothetical protein
MLRMQDAGEHALGCDPQGARHADLEAGAVVPVPVVRYAALQAAGSDDQVD